MVGHGQWRNNSASLALLSPSGRADHDQVTFREHRAQPRSGYGIALALALGPAVALGLARFGYALLLAPMRTSLHWSFTTAGALSTLNSVGYLAGALLAAPVIRWWGARLTFLAGIGLSALSMLATAVATGAPELFGLRTAAGISGAACFIAGTALVAKVSPPGSVRRAAALLSIYPAGIGVGIVISGAVVPWLLAAVSSPSGWRWGWVLFGGLGLLGFIVTVPAVRSCDEPPVRSRTHERWRVAGLAPLLACYVLFGVGYIGYLTFVVAYLQGRGASPGFITAFWIVLGAMVVAGAFGWAPVIGRLRAGRAPSLIMAVVSAGTLLPLLSRSPMAAIASAVIVGSSVVALVAAVMAVARRSLPAQHWASAITVLTVGFAAGQCLGPVLAGVLADHPAGLEAGLYASAGILAVGSIIALAQRHLDVNVSDAVVPGPGLVRTRTQGAGS
jgi:predicted MFS family arabinose efflux permease